ncbi:hypothetical protein LshimejAT787_3400070 [Lyophyllum shimeji]|uniref:Uncharacterized protein n=1 Tax=Lyophyllum shimeji TaxID=47721 RepID=A0A9P3UNT8_LYOSH|nr:hypothetical protein LshimejAT787_1005790 [Lyophyllum shimeji]GLB45750.1 hypothetical protein LshimejAT787_2700200 [Lyophyllum shimeji]GLB45867.1 hypothetical protein LshimejAT787_3400070 [Lyophyllum shimeji]
MFNSLRALPALNPLIRAVVDALIKGDHQLCVLHIPGEENTVADLLSRGRIADAVTLVPDLQVIPFQPPRELLGQRKNDPLPNQVTAARCAIDASTWRNYGSALNSYLSFVRMHHFPLKPTPATLSFFVVYMCHHINPRSVVNYLSGICNQLEPYFPDVRAVRKSPLVSKTLAGCQRLHGVPTVRKQPLSRNDLGRVVAHYAGSSHHDDRLFVSLLLTGFYALMHLGELTWPDNAALQDDKKTTKVRSVVVSPTSTSSPYLARKPIGSSRATASSSVPSTTHPTPIPTSCLISPRATRASHLRANYG